MKGLKKMKSKPRKKKDKRRQRRHKKKKKRKTPIAEKKTLSAQCLYTDL